MRHAFRHPIAALFLSVLVTVGAPAVAGKRSNPPATIPTHVGPTISPINNLFLSNSPSTDPSRYIGRFVADNATILDESSSRKTRCSTYITHATVGAANVERDEIFQSSVQAAAALNLPFIESVGSGSNAMAVRIHYTATQKMVSDIEDPGAFEDCCKAAPDQCTRRYISEFVEGTGQLFYALGREGQVDLKAADRLGAGEVEVKGGMVWKAGFRFPEPVYFAFKTAESGWIPDEVCATNWREVLPTSTQGTYFRGLSGWITDDLALAQQQAMEDAKRRVCDYQGNSFEHSKGQGTSFTNGGPTIGSGNTSSSSACAAVLSGMVEKCWATDNGAAGSGHMYRSAALVFVPNPGSGAPSGARLPLAGGK